MRHKLKDGRVVQIVWLSPKVPAKALQKYINDIIEEDVWIHYTKKFSLKEQEEWKKNTLGAIKKNQQMYLAAIYGNEVVGSCSAIRGVGRGEGNVKLGLAVSKAFRREGLGEFLMRETISQIKKKWNPKNTYLDVAGPNKAAQKLYTKLGFVEFARFPKWVKRHGEYHDFVWMILKNPKPLK